MGARNNDVQVEFTVEVPAGVNFVGRSTNGAVSAENLPASVEAYTTNGNVRIQGGSRAVARTTNGSVTIRTSGDADARTTNGNITAELGSLAGTTPLSFATTNGSISITLPADAGVDIDARTSNGRINTDFPLTVQGSQTRNRLSGVIGGGGRTVELRTTNGGIRIQRRG
jgi:DUF4097 and DUF4098 domain-containing protein YvlB